MLVPSDQVILTKPYGGTLVAAIVYGAGQDGNREFTGDPGNLSSRIRFEGIQGLDIGRPIFRRQLRRGNFLQWSASVWQLRRCRSTRGQTCSRHLSGGRNGSGHRASVGDVAILKASKPK